MKLLKLTNLSLMALGLALAQPAFAADKEKASDKVTAHDKAWAEMAAVSDLTEITLAKAAQEKAQSEAVKQHAAQMIQDHTKTTAELKAWAKKNDVDLKADLPDPKEKMVKEITSKSGAEFEKAYMEHEIAGHRHAVTHFQNGAEFNKNEELRAFAAQNLPTIQSHLAMVDKGGNHGQHATGAQPAGGAGSGTAGSGARTSRPDSGSGSGASGQVKTE